MGRLWVIPTNHWADPSAQASPITNSKALIPTLHFGFNYYKFNKLLNLYYLCFKYILLGDSFLFKSGMNFWNSQYLSACDKMFNILNSSNNVLILFLFDLAWNPINQSEISLYLSFENFSDDIMHKICIRIWQWRYIVFSVCLRSL